MNRTDNTLAELDAKQKKLDYQRVVKALQKKKYSKALLLLTSIQNQYLYKTDYEDESHGLSSYFITIQSAWCHFEQNQLAEAKEMLENGLRKAPLDGPMNLFLAYIHLIEDNKPAAIHRYTVLYDNPFYQKRVEDILDKIRYSDSITELLSIQPKSYFYNHDLPTIWSRFNLSGLLEILLRLVSVIGYRGNKKANHDITATSISLNKLYVQSKSDYDSNKQKTSQIQKLFSLLGGKKQKVLFLILGFTVLFVSIVIWWRDIMYLSPVNTKNSVEGLFSPQNWSDFSEGEVMSWLAEYRLLEQAINLRQFNEAIRIYNTINGSDIPIEIKNKFFILYRFIVNPQFEDLPTTKSFIDISPKDHKDFFYKFNFRVLQSQKGDTVKYLIELPQDSEVSSSTKNFLGLYAYRAVLSIDSSETDFNFFKTKVYYEGITKLYGIDRNYLHFKVLVAREIVGADE